MKASLFITIILLGVQTLAQNNPVLGDKDSLTFHYSTGGKIDSLDIQFSKHSSTLSGGGFGKQENILPYNFFIQNNGGTVFRKFENWKKMRFSGLPHLGFGYIFGGQATQIVLANYTHAFDQRNLLNVDYEMQKGNAFLRNSQFGHHDVQLKFLHEGDFYSFIVRGQFMQHTIGHSDGVLSDTLLDYYALKFAPVRKANANSINKGGRIELEHYFDFLKKDSTNATGLYVENNLNIFNRKYAEYSDTLSAMYGTINISSDSTNDQYQLSKLSNIAGIYFSRKGFYLKAGLQYSHWKYFNLAHDLKRNEVNLDGKIGIDIKRVSLENHTNINFIGAKGEWFTNTKLKFKWNQFALDAKADVSFLLPDPFQRSYYANNLYYQLNFDDLKNQFRMDIAGNLSYTHSKFKVETYVKNATATNNYWYNNGQWSNDTLTALNALSIGIKGKTGYKALNFSLDASYNASNWMPDLLVQGRLYVQGRLFKGKKLLANFGVEGSYHTGYKMMTINPLMDIFQLSNNSAQAMANLHVFGALEISKFRFFARVENLGSFWNEKTWQLANNYPIPGMQFRIGITWDFIN